MPAYLDKNFISINLKSPTTVGIGITRWLKHKAQNINFKIYFLICFHKPKNRQKGRDSRLNFVSSILGVIYTGICLIRQKKTWLRRLLSYFILRELSFVMLFIFTKLSLSLPCLLLRSMLILSPVIYFSVQCPNYILD